MASRKLRFLAPFNPKKDEEQLAVHGSFIGSFYKLAETPKIYITHPRPQPLCMVLGWGWGGGGVGGRGGGVRAYHIPRK